MHFYPGMKGCIFNSRVHHARISDRYPIIHTVPLWEGKIDDQSPFPRLFDLGITPKRLYITPEGICSGAKGPATLPAAIVLHPNTVEQLVDECSMTADWMSQIDTATGVRTYLNPFPQACK